MANEFNAKGRRMVFEEDIEKIGEGGGGTEYTEGVGIKIENDQISANIKEGSGIVVDTDLTDNSLVVMIDQEDIPYKSDLATVATTGDYDDLTNKPTIPVVSANTGVTPSATLTDLNVDGTVYSVGGGSSIEIDEQTIVEDGVTGKIKTAVGGYSEEQSLGYGPKLVGTSSDWDLADATLANTLYNMLDVNVQYPVTLKFINCTPDQEISSVYIESSDKTEARFGGNGAMHITTVNQDEYSWEFYVDISLHNIHIYTSNNLLIPVTGSNIIIDFGSESGLPEVIETVYHTIDSNFIPDPTTNIRLGNGLKLEDSKLAVKTYRPYDSPVDLSTDNNGVYAQLNYEPEEFYLGSEHKLHTFVDGGYISKVIIDMSQITAVSDNYTTTQTDLQEFVKNVVLSEVKEFYRKYNPSAGSYNGYSIPGDDYCLKTDSTTSYPNSYIYITVDSNDRNICTVQFLSGSSIIYQFGYTNYTCNLSTNTITPDTTTYPFIIGSDTYNYLINNPNSYFYCKTPIYGNTPKIISNKFLPPIPSADEKTIVYNKNEKVFSTVVGGGYSSENIVVDSSSFVLDGSNYRCLDDTFLKAFLSTVLYIYNNLGSGDASFGFLDSNDTRQDEFFEWTQSGGTYQFTNLITGTFEEDEYGEATNYSTIRFTPAFVDDFITAYDIVSLINEYPSGAKIITPINAAFIPVESRLYLHNFKIVTNDGTRDTHLEAQILTKLSNPITTITELRDQIMNMQETAGDDSTVGVMYGQVYQGNDKIAILGFGCKEASGVYSLYAIVSKSTTSCPNYGNAISSSQVNVQWMNNIHGAIGTEVTAQCSDIVTGTIELIHY